MPPRAVRRPSTATALKKRPIPKTDAETEDEAKETESVDQRVGGSVLSDSGNEQPRAKKDFSAVEYHDMDRAERLDLDDHEPSSEPDDDPASQSALELIHHATVRNDIPDEMEPNWDEEDYGNGLEMIEEEEEIDGQEEELLDGDEEEERNEVVQERRKRKELEIFVGGLDREATEEDLRKVFSDVGEVTEIRLLKIPGTQKNKGFAFLRFATVEQARRAVNELKHPVVHGKRCGVSPSQDSDTLFVGNICKNWSKEVLKEKLAKYGVNKYEELTLVEDAKNEGMNTGFAFLDFSSRSDALDVCRRLQKRDVVLGTDRPAKVSFTDTFIEPDDEIMAQVRTIFIDGLPVSWDEEEAKDHLTRFGEIEKVELARHMPAAKRQDFGFITFDTHDTAVACIEGINNTELSDGDKMVKVRARLSRPRQRVKPSRHGRGGYPFARGGSRGGRASWNYQMESWRLGGQSQRALEGRPMYNDNFRRFEGPRARYPIDVGMDRVGSRRGFPPTERSHYWRSPVPSNGKVNLKRDYIRHAERHPRSAYFLSRAATDRRLTHRDEAYPSRELDYLDSLPHGASRSATRRPSLYAEESYGRPVERSSSYRDSHIREYGSISGVKRPHSAMDDLPPRYGESAGRHSRARYDYAPNSAAPPYVENDFYAHESTRLAQSHLGYERGSRGARGHSHESYEARTSSSGYSRGGVRKGDAGSIL
ncbi:heterogeneous nuclear ribonucleoprotein Q-like isoform X2 [Aristolochia californica]|uniref:heterogeneous nuclear ribonucleoprotein Q-like isoform X2 n=1 Tax=Aristolochia californica TaxID=171875 RepID=UPI0035D8D3A9